MNELHKQLINILITAILGQVALVPVIKNEMSHMQKDIDKTAQEVCDIKKETDSNSNRITWLEAKAASK